VMVFWTDGPKSRVVACYEGVMGVVNVVALFWDGGLKLKWS
jgi:hypothetical protein